MQKLKLLGGIYEVRSSGRRRCRACAKFPIVYFRHVNGYGGM
jgi:hypothetical protein